jgi:hypothetical protein
MKDKILELCREDDYGVWELAGAVGIRLSKDEGLPQFVRQIQELVRSGDIVAKRRDAAKAHLERVELDDSELSRQLSRLEHPNPDSDYWFGLPS